jgi:putative mRNA 3-end processing factor
MSQQRMAHPKKWLEIHPAGLYCIPGQFYIDPRFPVASAIITHAHGDHARSGHKKVLASVGTIEIMKVRYGEGCAEKLQSMTYREPLTENGVKITLLPAGHILGSAQVLLEYKNHSVIISGDFKRSLDPTCEAFEVRPCDIFITEATFGLPVFIHPPIEMEIQKLLRSLQQNPNNTHLIGAYALGKCQRLIKVLRDQGYEDPIYLHGAQIKLCNLYQTLGVDLGALENANVLNQKNSVGKIIICPPSALHDRWSRRFAEVIVAYASGWMQIRARAKQKGIDLPLIISDHADWNELTQTLEQVNPQELWVTHGREEALVYYAEQQGYKAQALNLLGFDDQEDD